MNTDTESLGQNDEEIGVQVFDERDIEHVVHVTRDGAVSEHYADVYSHKVEDRSEQEQRIMSQVEGRAKYAAKREFEEADILEPMWDVPHLEAGLEALSRYSLGKFHREFRDFYDALDDPGAFITGEFDIEDVEVSNSYHSREGSSSTSGTSPSGTSPATAPPTTTAPSRVSPRGTQRLHSPGVGVRRRLRLRGVVPGSRHSASPGVDSGLLPPRGRDAPEEYQVEGIGEFDIHGDGLGAV